MILILIAAFAMFVVGAVWFTLLFGKKWSELMGRTKEEMDRYTEQGGMASKMGVMFLMNVVSAYTVYFLFSQVFALSFYEFILTSLVVWTGFSLPIFMNAYLWEGKSWKLVAINAGGSLVSLVTIVYIIYYFK